MIINCHAHARFPGPEDWDPNYTPKAKGEICCSGCCRAFLISFSFIGFVVFLLSGIFFLLIQHRFTPFAYCLLFAFICLFVLTYVITAHSESLSTRPPRTPPSEVAQHEESNRPSLLRRYQTDGVRINIPGQTESTLSLPAYIVIPTGQEERRESSKVSTESTLRAGEPREGQDEEETKLTPLAGEALKEATETLENVVHETLHGRGSAEEAAEGGSELNSEEARRVLLQGVRQRRKSAMEPQKKVPSPEDERTQ